MFNFFTTILALHSDKRGVTALEYGLIAAAICVAASTGFTAISGHLGTVLNTVNNAV